MEIKDLEEKPTVVLFVGLDEKVNRLFSHLKYDGFYNEKNHYCLVHIINDKTKKLLPPNVDPHDDDQVHDYIKNKFHSVVKAFNIFRDDSNKATTQNFSTDILFNKDVKLRAITYLKEIDADSCIIVTKGEQELDQYGSDSFAYYLVAHAPCDVLVLRPEA